MTSDLGRYRYALLIISLILLGIWAVKDTIALRNILLIAGALLSAFYIRQEWRSHKSFSQIRFINLLPSIFILCMFIWIVVHYCLISAERELQWKEFSSTWFRSFLAACLGLGTGLALHHIKHLLPWLWAGIMASFAYLIYQYVPKAQALHSLFATDWSPGYYIYIGKINGVLMGSVLVAGLVGAWIDRFRSDFFKLSTWVSLFCLLGIALTLYSYVFIFDTRNGLGVAFILIAAWMGTGFFWSMLHSFKDKSMSGLKTVIAPILVVALVMSWFGYQQIQRNSGWATMMEDASIAMQTDKYPNWQDTDKFGLPKTESGRTVALNTYQRVSWAKIGFSLLPESPWGKGVLAESFGRSLKKKYPQSTPISTHSAWLEVGLAYGFPGIVFTAGTLCFILVSVLLSKTNSFSASIISIGFTLLFLYSIGELSTQHGIEVLFYLMALLAALQLPIVGQSFTVSPVQDRQ